MLETMACSSKFAGPMMMVGLLAAWTDASAADGATTRAATMARAPTTRECLKRMGIYLSRLGGAEHAPSARARWYRHGTVA